jgi:hypothetical protein
VAFGLGGLGRVGEQPGATVQGEIMPMHQWHEQTTALKQELKDAIASREKTFKRTIPNYLCLNNLKSKLARLETIERNLAIDKYMLVFIGTIGEGKTTAICHLFNLVGEFSVSKTIAGKAKTIKEIQELLATGSGRVTICEVLIQASDQTYMEVEPYSPQEMENMILDFCDSLSDPANVQGEQKGMLSKEIETAHTTSQGVGHDQGRGQACDDTNRPGKRGIGKVRSRWLKNGSDPECQLG